MLSFFSISLISVISDSIFVFSQTPNSTDGRLVPPPPLNATSIICYPETSNTNLNSTDGRLVPPPPLNATSIICYPETSNTNLNSNESITIKEENVNTITLIIAIIGAVTGALGLYLNTRSFKAGTASQFISTLRLLSNTLDDLEYSETRKFERIDPSKLNEKEKNAYERWGTKYLNTLDEIAYYFELNYLDKRIIGYYESSFKLGSQVLKNPLMKYKRGSLPHLEKRIELLKSD